jgi:hypothetical protein
MALSYSEIVGALEQEFFLAKIRSQVDGIDDPEELRAIVMSLVDLLQHQKDTFLAMMEMELDTDLGGV